MFAYRVNWCISLCAWYALAETVTVMKQQIYMT